MSTKVLTLFVVLSFGLGACGTPASDLEAFCSIVETVMKDKKKEKKEFAIMKRVSMDLKTAEALDLLKAVAETSPKKRYKKLLKGAKDLGVKGFKCKAAQKWFKDEARKKKK